MALLPLFDTGDTVLADDGRGRIVYTPSLVDGATAAAWFAELREAVAWKAERRRMYDRDVDVPRLTSHYRLEPREDGIPASILAAARIVVTRTEVPFNSVGLNLYRDGKDSVAPHNDHLEVLVEGFPIALLSLGGTRRMAIRAKKPPKAAFDVDLAPGSLLLMSYETQIHYTHGVPKTKEAVAERISLAFRVKPAAAEGADPYR